MTRIPTVAVVRSDNRRGAVAEALALIGHDLRSRVDARSPGQGEPRQPRPSAPLDPRRHPLRNARRALERGGRTSGRRRRGQRRHGRFPSLRLSSRRPSAGPSTTSTSIETNPTGIPTGTGLRRRLAAGRAGLVGRSPRRPCRVSLAPMKTHVTSMVTFGLKNMLSSIHPDDRIMMHGHAGGGNGYQGWKRPVVEFLKGDSTLVNILTRSMGRVRKLQAALSGQESTRRLGSGSRPPRSPISARSRR